MLAIDDVALEMDVVGRELALDDGDVGAIHGSQHVVAALQQTRFGCGGGGAAEGWTDEGSGGQTALGVAGAARPAGVEGLHAESGAAAASQ